jgi:Putative Flp pilus-assembly TadE/G-like
MGLFAGSRSVPERRGRSASRNGERGQVAVLFAILAPFLLIPIGAIVLDIGFWYVQQKHEQTTADAAALAGAREIPNTAAVDAVAREYVLRNMANVAADDIVVEYPYVPDSGPNAGQPQVDEVEVTVSHPAGVLFGRIFGVIELEITRRAVAEKFEIPGNLAIFSYQHPLCGSGLGLEFNGDNMNINGLVHSNAAFQINGKDFWAADGTIQRNNCVPDLDDPPTSQFGDDPDATAPRDLWPPPGHQPWPVWHTPGEFGWLNNCTKHGQKITINATELKIENPNSTTPIVAKTIPTGSYCATETFEISGDGLKGAFTAVAREIKVSGKQHDFTYFKNRTLFFAVPNSNYDLGDDGPDTYNCQNDKEMTLNAHEYKWKGTIFSPCTRIVINGDNLSTLEGTIVGYQVKVNGQNFNMIGKSEVPAIIELNLVE